MNRKADESDCDCGLRPIDLPRRIYQLKSFSLLGLIVLLLGCADAATPTPTTTPSASVTPAPLVRTLATLVPTFTPVPPFVPSATPAPNDESTAAVSPTPSPTAVSFDEIIVDLSYSIPGLGLERRLQGNRANRITVTDESTGQVATYGNQGGILLEMRQALAEVELDTLPADCELCVHLEFELSLEGETDEGWLRDEVLLASIENFLTVALDAHFPPETAVGLRRSASVFAPAHTVALTSDGQLWTWLATDGRVSEPSTSITATQPLQRELTSLPLEDIDDAYVVRCSGSPVETLFLAPNGDSRTVSIVCPEFSLPSTLQPLYLQLNAFLAPVVADVSLERPPSAFSLAALIDYRRADGARLTLYHDGSVTAINGDSIFTSTLTTTAVISLTTDLLDTSLLQPGLGVFEVTPTATITSGVPTGTPMSRSTVVVRGPEGLYEGEWMQPTPEVPALLALDTLLEDLLESREGIEPEIVETPSPTATPVPEPTPSPTP